MDNELTQLDALIESDVLDALGKNPTSVDSEEILIEDIVDDSNNEPPTKEDSDKNKETHLEEAQISDLDTPISEDIIDTPINLEQNINATSLSKFLGELLNNKTIEITIKIKE